MPVDDIGARVIALAGSQVPERLSAFLNAGPAWLDEQQLAARMAVPGRACTRLETTTGHGRALVLQRFGFSCEAGFVGPCGSGLRCRASPGDGAGKENGER